MNAGSAIPNWWAVEAMIASYNHAYEVVYDTRYENLGAIGVSVYGNAPVASFQNEFLALDTNPEAVIQAVTMYPKEPETFHVLDVFHPGPEAPELLGQYQKLGYQALRSGPLLGLELASIQGANEYPVKAIQTLLQVEMANQTLADEGEYISPKTLRLDSIRSFAVDANEETVGWAQLIAIHPSVAYLNQLYVMKHFRGRGLEKALAQRAQMEAAVLGKRYITVVPGEDSLEMYLDLGYRPLVYFTALEPKA